VAPSRSNGVLICVYGEAVEIPAVASALRDRWDVEALLFDPARFPTGIALSAEYSSGGAFGCRPEGRPEVWPRIDAIWQGVVVGSALASDALGLDDATRRTCIAASEMALVGALESMEAFQLDPYWSAARASSKPYQLRVAPACGLEVPETLVSNDPDAVRAFARVCGGLVTKMLVQPDAPAGDGNVAVFTTPVSEADLADLDGLRLCPMIFQQRIEKASDVRVSVVGHQVFAAALDTAAATDGSEVDWRREPAVSGERVRWAPCELPAEVVAGLLRMLDHLGLNQGACDFVRTPEGRYVFLELNPFGSFCFLGPALADPIAAAIADVLVDPAARRVPAPPRAGR
jgi:glutathione synthase/RimK-type ligase-like ATP-grasp enzyme